MNHHPGRAALLGGGASVAIMLGVAASFTVARPAAATEAFMKETGKPCGECHEAPAGGGKLTPFGEKFKANGNKVPAATK
jgi:hypothetical protein